MSAHTAGPWMWGPNARRHADTSLPECLRVLNVGAGKTTALCWDEHDARLIAAAPALLDAARCALADLEGAAAEIDPSGDRVHPVWRTIKELRAAIERATGGAP